ncbi:hypothetical protein GCM10010987_63410 [Bradyrhizobium guangdongense]|uniref:Uncharacterized protein n=1 Tax=Bradyrhizobium guangdongense TaxID=1325090 RepID=A0AA87WDS0_9BRAD|nr:hypothetical protein GCM10010987_63410 [Bradyrhizobium guangdongense]
MLAEGEKEAEQRAAQRRSVGDMLGRCGHALAADLELKYAPCVHTSSGKVGSKAGRVAVDRAPPVLRPVVQLRP